MGVSGLMRVWSHLKKSVETTNNALCRLKKHEAARLKKRLRWFLICYMPCIAVVLIMIISGSGVNAKSSSQQKDNRSTTEDSRQSNGGSYGSAVQQQINRMESSDIYTYNAGGSNPSDSATQYTDVPFITSDNLVEDATDLVLGLKEWVLKDGFEIATGTIDPSLPPLQQLVISLMSYIYTETFKAGSMIFRISIGAPFLIIEIILRMFGTGFYPTSLYGIFLGRVGSGGQLTTNIFAFEMTQNNIYGIAGSIIYSILSGIIVIGIIIKIAGSIMQAAWRSGSSDGRSKFKTSITYNIGSLVLLFAMPFLFMLAEYARDLILFVVLQAVEEVSTMSIRVGAVAPTNAISDVRSWIFCYMPSHILTGASYNPFLAKAFDFTNGTIIDTFLYAGSTILTIVFMFIYMSLALDTMISFGTFGSALLNGKDAVVEWIRHIVANLLTPVMDMLVMMVPLILGSLSNSSPGAFYSVGFIQIMLCIVYFPLRSSVRSKLGLMSAQSSEQMGLGSMMMALTGARMLMSSAGRMVDGVRSGMEASASDMAAATMADRDNEGLRAETSSIGRDLDSLNDKLQTTTGADDDLTDQTMSGSGGLPGMESGDTMNGLSDEIPNDVLNEDVAGDSIEKTLSGLPSEAIDEKTEGESEADGISGESTAMKLATASSEKQDELSSDPAKTLEAQAVRASNMSEAFEEKSQQHTRNAQQLEEHAAHLNTQLSKLSPQSGEYKDIRTQMLQTREDAIRERNLSMQNREYMKQADTACNAIRRRMGLSGSGRISAAELEQIHTLQASANMANFDSTLMAKALSPKQQAKFYRERAAQARRSVTAGVVTTTALSSVIGPGSLFLPTTAKMVGVGAAMGAGNIVMQSSYRNAMRAAQGGIVPTGLPFVSYRIGTGMNTGGPDLPPTPNGGGTQMASSGMAAQNDALRQVESALVNQLNAFSTGRFAAGAYNLPSGTTPEMCNYLDIMIDRAIGDSQRTDSAGIATSLANPTDLAVGISLCNREAMMHGDSPLRMALDKVGFTESMASRIVKDSSFAQDICRYGDYMRFCRQAKGLRDLGIQNEHRSGYNQAVELVPKERLYDEVLARMNNDTEAATRQVQDVIVCYTALNSAYNTCGLGQAKEGDAKRSLLKSNIATFERLFGEVKRSEHKA